MSLRSSGACRGRAPARSLRTGFAWVNGQPVAGIVPADGYRFVLVRRRCVEPRRPRKSAVKALQLKRAKLLAEQEAWMPFDVSRAPLFRARLLAAGADDHVLLITIHHMIVDGWSIGIFFEEISKLYSAFAMADRIRYPNHRCSFRTWRVGSAGGARPMGGPATRLLEEQTCAELRPSSHGRQCRVAHV